MPLVEIAGRGRVLGCLSGAEPQGHLEFGESIPSGKKSILDGIK